MRLLIKQARIIDPRSPFHQQTADIFIENGYVQEIGSALHHSADVFIDHPNVCISPGFVDVFADMRDPGFEHKETLSTGLKAAAAGGFTHVSLLPNLQPVTDHKAAVKGMIKAAQGAVTQVHPLGAITQNTEGKALAEMLDMYEGGAVAFTDGWTPVQQSNLLLKALEYVKSFGGLLIQLPLEASLSAGGLMHEGLVSTQLGMPGIPEIAETLAVEHAIQLLRYTQSRIHLTGISSASSVEKIRTAKGEGLQISCSVTPYHLALNDEALRTYDALFKVDPPIRTEVDRLALIQGLKDGTIDAITSHHRPQDWDAKQKEFDYAGTGMNLLQFTFPIVWDAVQHTLSLERMIDALSISPRQILKLPDAIIQEKQLADFVLYSLEDNMRIDLQSNYSLSANNPFFGMELKGYILATIREKQVEMTKLPA